MEQDNLFNSRYRLDRLLGRGSFSEVWLAEDTKTGVMVALKIYAPATGLDDAGLDIFAREFSIVAGATHSCLLRPLHYDTAERKPFLVLPYCPKGSVKGSRGKMDERGAWRLIHDIASGLVCLHNMTPPIIHQDIKPDNIMEGDDGNYLIADFGVSTHLRSALRKSASAAFSSAGTLAYMAPERFSKDNDLIMASDIFSLGATVFEMLTGRPPFGDDGGLLLMKGAEVPELKGDFSRQLKEVVSRCLSLNPWERPTAEQLETWSDAALRCGKVDVGLPSKSRIGIPRIDLREMLRRHKKIVIAAAAVVVAAAIVLPLTLSRGGKGDTGKGDKAAAPQEVPAVVMTDPGDTLRVGIEKLVIQGDRLARNALLHGQGFETFLIDAKASYQEASVKSAFHPDGEAIRERLRLESKLLTMDSLLNEAYLEFAGKAAMMPPGPEADALLVRAQNVADALQAPQ